MHRPPETKCRKRRSGIARHACLGSSRSWIPVAFRLLAFASWAFVSRWGVAPFLRRAYRQTTGPHRGFHVPLWGDATGEDAAFTPGSWCPGVSCVRGHAFVQFAQVCRLDPWIVALAIVE